jgi:hypothetical protein
VTKEQASEITGEAEAKASENQGENKDTILARAQ